MINITKTKTESGYEIRLDDGKQSLIILFAGNLDLYWTIVSKKHIPLPDDVLNKSFIISKENYFIYSLFEKLYSDLRTCNLFEVQDYELNRCETIADELDLIKKNREMNLSFKRHDEYKRLFNNGIIEWRSDDFSWEEASILTIKKVEENYVINFQKSYVDELGYQTYAIRFRNSGSRYQPFNHLFMKMYNKLTDYEPNYHQTDIEEIIWQKKINK